jgi:hypothetical protein
VNISYSSCVVQYTSLTFYLLSNTSTFKQILVVRKTVLHCEEYTEYDILFCLYCNILNVHFVFCNKNIFRSAYTVSKASDEPLLPGDMIAYRHPIFVAGDPRGWRTATIRDIDPKRMSNPLRLDNMDCLNMYHCVRRHKVLQPDGTLREIPEDQHKWRWIKEFKLKKSQPAPYRMSTEGRRVGSLWRGLTDHIWHSQRNRVCHRT